MTTAIFTHPACLLHEMEPWHVESPARLESVLAALREPSFAALAWREAPEATREQLGRVHEPRYVDALLAAVPTEGYVRIDADTAMGRATGPAMLRAAGACVAAVDAVMAGAVTNAFCAARPPGHHAERARAMGFCFFNNVAVAALHARAVHGLARVAVIDFDVHHGNGTQHAFERDAGLFYASTHQDPFYPGTGHANERGVAGNIVNVPLRGGSDGAVVRRAYTETILPALEAFAPEFVLLSAGFDAHHADPLGGLGYNEDDYAWITRELCAVAARHAQGRVVSALEGGYDLAALAASASAHVRALMAA
jgi:acetoin utilization deacetylase AcuC-like enzyme